MAKNKNKNKGSNVTENKNLVPESEEVISEDKDVVVDTTEEIKQVDENLTDTITEPEETVEKFEETPLLEKTDDLPAPLAGTFEDANIVQFPPEEKLDLPEIPEEVLPVKNYIFSLTEAIDFSKNNSTKDLLEKLLTEGHLDIKLFAAELSDVINAYNKKSELEANNGNRKLFNLLVRILKVENATEFKFKFDVINRIFLEDENFNPVTLLNCTLWSKSEKDIATFAQLATIIEDLADRSTRNENKKRIANLNNLNLDTKSLENIKNYYKL